MVLAATGKHSKHEGVPLVVKISCPEETRTPETDILNTIEKVLGHPLEITNHILLYTAIKSVNYSTSQIANA